MTTIWRLHIKPEGIDPHRFCMEKGILGVGWPTNSDAHANWAHYCAEAQQQYTGDAGWRKAANAIGNRMRRNDLCWTRDRSNTYYLGRVTGDWEYRGAEEYRTADLVNVRACQWLRIGAQDSVPGKVVDSLRRGATLQAIDDPTVARYSKVAYNLQSTEFRYKPEEPDADIFSMLLPEDLEDVVALYLQSLGYWLIASTCKADTKAYEFVLKHKESGGRCVAQVKSGKVDIDVKSLEDVPADAIFFFTSKGSYQGVAPETVKCLKPELIRDFLHGNLKAMPDRIQKWVRWLEDSK